MKANQSAIPGWVVLAVMGALALVLLQIWVVLPWAAALMATCAAFLGFEFGTAATRWAEGAAMKRGNTHDQ